jgi:AcrR family transcriptional regulator
LNAETTTKDRLLDAAEDLFAHKSFDEVSVRELAAAAEVNVAAVNYHFQGKDNLYQEVILRRFVHQRDRTLAALDQVLAGAGGQPSLEDVIGALVRQYLQGTLGETGTGFLAFIAREMHSCPNQGQDSMFKEMIAPVFAAFSRALQAAHPGLRPEDLTWIIASIVGQIHHFIFRWQRKQTLDAESESLQTMVRIFPPLNYSVDRYIDTVTGHITRFSSAAVMTLYPEVSS